MPITAAQLNFRRLQSDGGPITVFASGNMTDAEGNTIPSPNWKQTDVTLTADEKGVIDGIITRAKAQIEKKEANDSEAAKAAVAEE